MNFKELILNQIEEQEYTMSSISKKFKVNVSNLRNMINGNRKYTRTIVKSIKEILNLSVPKELRSNRKINTLTKSKYRSPVKEGVRCTLGAYVSPNSKILTLPSYAGFDVNTFRKYGAIPKNITCVEEDQATYLKYRKLKNGTNDFRMTLLKYLMFIHKGMLDVSFLDFCGTLTETVASCIYKVGNITNLNGVIGITLNICHRTKNELHNARMINKVEELLPKFKLISANYYNDEGKRSDMVFLLFKKGK